MSQEQWTSVDRYFSDQLVPHDPALEAALKASADAGLPPINVSPTQGRLLHLLARLQGARKILEIGTLGGYSTIWLARALPEDGHLVTLEALAKHARIAEANIANAGLADIVEIRVGAALDTLPRLAEEGKGPFDLTFIDADKERIPEYFRWALEMSHPGSVVIVDNVVRGGAVTDAATSDPDVKGVRRFLELLASEPRVTGTAIQTVGSKGWDGLALAVVN
jgi:predicted O-methyltransferase YrrM